MSKRARRVTGYAYPWDIARDPLRAQEWHKLGITDVVLPVNYHAVRALSWNSDRSPRIVSLGSSRRMEDFFDAYQVALEAGLQVTPWFVVNHVDDGYPSPTLSTRDAWGNLSICGHCPSRPLVRSEAVRLISSTVGDIGSNRVLVESLSPPGVDHAWLHDKLPLSRMSDTQLLYLSLCYCEACASNLETAGRSARYDAAVVRQAFDEDDYAVAQVEAWFSMRQEVIRRFIGELCEATGGAQLIVAGTSALDGFGPAAPLSPVPPGVTPMAHLDQERGLEDAVFWRESGLRTAGTIDLSTEVDPIKIGAVDDPFFYHLGMISPLILSRKISDVAAILREE